MYIFFKHLQYVHIIYFHLKHFVFLSLAYGMISLYNQNWIQNLIDVVLIHSNKDLHTTSESQRVHFILFHNYKQCLNSIHDQMYFIHMNNGRIVSFSFLIQEHVNLERERKIMWRMKVGCIYIITTPPPVLGLSTN